MIEANCEACGKTWQLPHGNRGFSCKDCGGRVDPRPLCRSCGEPRSAIDAFCQSCGTEVAESVDVLGLAPTAGPSFQKGRGPSDAEATMDRHLALREYGKHKKTLRAMQVYLGVCLIIQVFSLFAVVVISAKGEIPGWILFIQFMVVALYFSAMVRVRRQPLLWTLSTAAMQTVFTAVNLIHGDLSLFGLITTACIWGIVFPAARLEKIYQDFPDLADAEIRGRRKRSAAPLAHDARRARQRQATRKERQFVLGIFAAVTCVAVLLVNLATARPSLESRLETFESAWNEGSLEEVLRQGDPEKGALLQRRMEDSLLRRGWLKNRPRLGQARVEGQDHDEPEVSYSIEEGHLVLKFTCRGDAWILKSIQFPEARPTVAIDATLDRFAEAWNRKDYESLAQLLKNEDKADLISKRCQRWVQELDDKIGSSKIESRSVSDRGNGFVRVDFSFGGASMKTTWEWQYPVWRFRSASAPK